MTCPRCHGEAVRPEKGPIDACDLCTRLAEIEYREFKLYQRETKK